ncbi:IGHG protein, partial [Polyodon spathula]|nr:IGHG protein [Polyodon spathula]
VPPKVSEILIPEMIFGNETVTLICNISAFRPKQAQVKWLRLSHNQSLQENEHCSSSECIPLQQAGEDLSDMAVNKPFKHGRLYSTVLTLDDDNRKYRYRVQHGRSKSIIKSTTLRVKVRASYCQRTSLPVVYTCRVYHESFIGFKELTYRINLQVLWLTSDLPQSEVGKECTLTCHMNNFCPDTITIKWLKNNRQLDNGVSRSPSILGTNGRYSLYSFLKLTPTREDQGSVIKCIVEHSALTNSEERSYRLPLVS